MYTGTWTYPHRTIFMVTFVRSTDGEIQVDEKKPKNEKITFILIPTFAPCWAPQNILSSYQSKGEEIRGGFFPVLSFQDPFSRF